MHISPLITYAGNFYRPQRSCGQGNVFTGVCLSTRGEGVCLSACWDAIPPSGPGRPPPRMENTPPGWRTPPGKQTPAYGLRAAGTHPTGMHSCQAMFSKKILCYFVKACSHFDDNDKLNQSILFSIAVIV